MEIKEADLVKIKKKIEDLERQNAVISASIEELSQQRDFLTSGLKDRFPTDAEMTAHFNALIKKYLLSEG